MTRKKAMIITAVVAGVLFLIVNTVLAILSGLSAGGDYVQAHAYVPAYVAAEEFPEPGTVPEQDIEDTYIPAGSAPEPDDDLLFPRIDLDEIDFGSLVISTLTPHGYIGQWYVRHLSRYLPNREPFTYREYDAARWLANMLVAKGFDESLVEIQSFPIETFGMALRYFPPMWHNGHLTRGYSQNVIATIPGQSPQKIILGAHYDTVWYPGASDNASGTGLMMENAQRMLEADNYYTLVYVFFGAEEIGLLGAFYYYESLTPEERGNILFMVNADVILDGPVMFYAAGYAYGDGWGARPRTNYLTERVDGIAGRVNYAHGLELTPVHDGVLLSTDQLVFAWEGHSVIVFWAANEPSLSTLDMDVLHSYRDCYEFINAEWPERIESTMRAFSLFLEEIILY